VIDEIFHLNVLGPIVAMQAVIPLMRAQGAGSIVNINSGTAFMTSTSFRKFFMIFCLPCGARFSVQQRTSVRRGPVERRGARNCGLKPTAAR